MEIKTHGHVLLLGDSKKRKEESNMRNWKKNLDGYSSGNSFLIDAVGNVDSLGTKLYSGVVVVKFEIKVDFGKMWAIIYEDLKSLHLGLCA